jgi:hypothetical protein
MNVARDHHYAPQFFLRNFAIDPARCKLTTVAKHGPRAVWAKRSIKNLGYERDLYVYIRDGVPVSIEASIGASFETPISKTDTWAKITAGRSDALDRSDKPILYALIRHLEVRTPHYLSTTMELANLAASKTSNITFTEEEREMYAFLRRHPDAFKANFAAMSSSLNWTEENFVRAGISILRSPIPLRSSTTPVLALTSIEHPSLHLPLPGMVPYQLILTLNQRTIATLVLADFDDAFMNIEITMDQARAFNRHFVSQFAYFDHVRHLITGRDDLITDMTWAPYEVVQNTAEKIKFRQRS